MPDALRGPRPIPQLNNRTTSVRGESWLRTLRLQGIGRDLDAIARAQLLVERRVRLAPLRVDEVTLDGIANLRESWQTGIAPGSNADQMHAIPRCNGSLPRVDWQCGNAFAEVSPEQPIEFGRRTVD